MSQARKPSECSLGDAKAHFAECVRAAEKGKTIVLTRHGRAVARLEPIEEARSAAPPAEEVGESVADYEARARTSFRSPDARREVLLRFLERELWPRIPEEMLDRAPTREEREEILGYGPEGV